MHLWRVDDHPKGDGFVYRASTGFGHALFAPFATHIFNLLRVSAAVWEHGAVWQVIYNEPGLNPFEVAYGAEAERHAYDARLLRKVTHTKRAVRGEHGGYYDLFVPIIARRKVVGVLVSGPFALARPSANDILERWSALTRRQGHLSDPEFSAYLAASLSVLVLDEGRDRRFEKALGLLTRLMSGEGRADELMNQIEALRLELETIRRAEWSFEVVRGMLDERSQDLWSSPPQIKHLSMLGLSHTADHVLVGFTVNRTQDRDPIDETVRRDGFQRACVDLARDVGNVVVGRIGDHAVVFLSAFGGSARRKRQKLLELANRVATMGRRRFGLSLHFGADVASASALVNQSYKAALAAAESALVKGASLLMAEPESTRPLHSLRHLRNELGKAAEERPDLFKARFDRFIEAIEANFGYRVEPSRVHLEVAFDQVAEGLVKGGALDSKSFRAMCDRLDREAHLARTVSELFTAYRQAVADVCAALEAPVAARQDRSLRRATEYIHQHYAEPLERAQVAKVAGFAPRYFSRLFRQQERFTFERYVHLLRIERAKQLLRATSLEAARIAELTGFQSAQYFSRAFRRATGKTPLAFRASDAGSIKKSYKDNRSPRSID